MKPEGYSTVSPYLVVTDAPAIIDFMKEAFGATELRLYENPDGSVMHAEVLIDDTVIMLGEGGEDWPPFSSLLHVYVDDVDKVFQRALDAGAEALQEPEQQPEDPDRRGSVQDPSGNIWSIATTLKDSE